MKNRPPHALDSDAPPADPALTSAQFHILLTLADGARHGYGIMQEIERRTDGAVELGPGTLYRSIKQLLARGLISEVHGGAEGQPEAGRQRRSYGLTPPGRARTAEEAARLQSLVRWAEDALVVEGGRP
ncbi:PadR family transcriptional regulator [Gemmatimonadota bacterium]